MKDGGELATAAHVLGVAHPTGFPAFCLAGKAFDLLPAGTTFLRLNLASAAGGAIAAAIAFLIAAFAAGGGRTARVAALVAAGAYLGAHGPWLHGTTTEVYSLSAAGLAAAILAFLHAARSGDARALALGWLLVGLGAGGHVTWPVEGAVAGVVATVATLRRLPGRRLQVLAASAVLAMLGAAVVLYLPAAAGRDPVANWGDPSGAGGLLDHLTGRRIRQSFHQIEGFHWSILRTHAADVASVAWEAHGPLWPLALAGLAVLLGAFPAGGLILGGVLAADVAFAAQVNPMGVRDLQTGVPAALAVAALAAVGTAWLARRTGGGSRWRPVLATAAAVAALGAQWAGSPAERDLTRFWAPREVAAEALESLPPRATLLTTSDDLSAGVEALQAVEGARPDVLSWVKQHLSDTTAVLAAVRRHAAGPADAALADAIRAHPFESAETPAQAVERAIRLAGQRGAVRVEPGEGAVDRDLLARWTPIFPVLDAAPADREAAADRAVARAEAHAPCSDRWGREYLAGYARLVGTGLALDGHDASALALLARALALSPDDPKTLHNLGVLLSDAGQPARGLDLLLRAVAVDPAYLRGWRSLAKIARAAGRDDLAAQADARARELEE